MTFWLFVNKRQEETRCLKKATRWENRDRKIFKFMSIYIFNFVHLQVSPAPYYLFINSAIYMFMYCAAIYRTSLSWCDVFIFKSIHCQRQL